MSSNYDSHEHLWYTGSLGWEEQYPETTICMLCGIEASSEEARTGLTGSRSPQPDGFYRPEIKPGFLRSNCTCTVVTGGQLIAPRGGCALHPTP